MDGSNHQQHFPLLGDLVVRFEDVLIVFSVRGDERREIVVISNNNLDVGWAKGSRNHSLTYKMGKTGQTKNAFF